MTPSSNFTGALDRNSARKRINNQGILTSADPHGNTVAVLDQAVLVDSPAAQMPQPLVRALYHGSSRPPFVSGRISRRRRIRSP